MEGFKYRKGLGDDLRDLRSQEDGKKKAQTFLRIAKDTNRYKAATLEHRETRNIKKDKASENISETQFDTTGTRMWEELKEIYPQGISMSTKHRYTKFLERLADQVDEKEITKEAATKELETTIGNLRANVASLEGKKPDELLDEAGALKRELLRLFYHDKSQLKSEYSDPWKVVPESIRTAFDNAFGQVFEKTGSTDYIQAKAKLEELRGLVTSARAISNP